MSIQDEKWLKQVKKKRKKKEMFRIWLRFCDCDHGFVKIKLNDDMMIKLEKTKGAKWDASYLQFFSDFKMARKN